MLRPEFIRAFLFSQRYQPSIQSVLDILVHYFHRSNAPFTVFYDQLSDIEESSPGGLSLSFQGEVSSSQETRLQPHVRCLYNLGDQFVIRIEWNEPDGKDGATLSAYHNHGVPPHDQEQFFRVRISLPSAGKNTSGSKEATRIMRLRPQTKLPLT